MTILKFKRSFQVDDIITYLDLVNEEGQTLSATALHSRDLRQKGMNFHVTPFYSVFLMSKKSSTQIVNVVRNNAPYADAIDSATGSIIYGGHDIHRTNNNNPKSVDQSLFTPNGSLTENGKFFIAAKSYRQGLIDEPHKIKIYEKIREGIWSYKGYFN